MNKLSTPRPLAIGLLLLFALGESGLSIYQWLELISVRSGGQAACAIGETLNCATVWNSAFASRVHAFTGLPVAALGLVWGFTAAALAGALLVFLKKGRPVTAVLNAVRLTAAAGALVCVALVAGSVSASAVCLTCLGTYALVIAYALTAFFAIPGPRMPAQGQLRGALAWAGGLTLLFWGILLPAGLSTPKLASGTLQNLPPKLVGGGTPVDAGPPAPMNEREQLVAEFLRRLSADEQQDIANKLALYRNAATKPVTVPTRRRYGPENAPVKVIDFTDIKCGHCKIFEDAITQIKRAVPSELMSVEARQFPLAGDCLTRMKRPDPTGVRCLAAKSLICLEDSPKFWEARAMMFADQESLNPDRVREIVTTVGFSPMQLDACLASPSTQEKLEQDMSLAESHGIEGTPFVLVNGRPAGAFPPSFLYALVMVGGNGNSAAFQSLPPPSISGRDPHEGHKH